MSKAFDRVVKRLEQAVDKATAQLESLRVENQTLRERIAELESARQAEESRSSESARAWEADRREVCERVEGLAAGLESILSEIEGD